MLPIAWRYKQNAKGLQSQVKENLRDFNLVIKFADSFRQRESPLNNYGIRYDTIADQVMSNPIQFVINIWTASNLDGVKKNNVENE